MSGRISVLLEHQTRFGTLLWGRTYLKEIESQNLPLELTRSLSLVQARDILLRHTFEIRTGSDGSSMLVIHPKEIAKRKQFQMIGAVDVVAAEERRLKQAANEQRLMDADKLIRTLSLEATVEIQEAMEAITQHVEEFLNTSSLQGQVQDRNTMEQLKVLGVGAPSGVTTGVAVWALLLGSTAVAPPLLALLATSGFFGTCWSVQRYYLKGGISKTELDRRLGRINILVAKFCQNELYDESYANHSGSEELISWLLSKEYIFDLDPVNPLKLDRRNNGYLTTQVVDKYKELSECYEADERQYVEATLKTMVLCLLAKSEDLRIPRFSVGDNLKRCAGILPADNLLRLYALYRAGFAFIKGGLEDNAREMLIQIPESSKLHEPAQLLLRSNRQTRQAIEGK
ncbi:MAG: hypothetical protein KDK50_04140 [Chlamydiia bacterium]|nr:hypothetical protein [Chlamydiia bacterium]